MITRKTILDDITSAAKDFLVKELFGSSVPGTNVLHQYRTFNYRVTLAIISNAEFNSQSYKRTGFDTIVMQSHGKGKGFDSIVGGDKTLDKIQQAINTISSINMPKYDFFLQELYIKSNFGSSQDWATELRMKILEPYSMDTFLNTLLEGLTKKGYYNFDRHCNFVVKVDFVGYKDDSEEPEVVPYSTRYYPINITKLDAQLTQEGTVYSLEASPINDAAKLEDANIIPNPLTISGDTVEDAMKALMFSVNEIMQEQEEKSGYYTNTYSVEFLNEKGNVVTASAAGGDVTSNIAAAKMFDPIKDAGQRQAKKPDTSVYVVGRSAKTNDENIEDSKLVISVDGGKGLIELINGIITESYFVIDKLRNEFKPYDQDGQIAWWRVVTKVKNDKWDKARNSYSKFITFQIVPRKVHYTKLAAVYFPSNVSSVQDYEPMIARTYEWQYTGNNKDILAFNMNFNQLWAKIVTANFGQSNAKTGEEKTAKTENVTGARAVQAQPETKAEDLAGTTTATSKNSDKPKTVQIRPNDTNPAWAHTRDVFEFMNNPNEQISFNIDILGDPMWLGTQFIDNSNNVGNGSKLFTADGGIAIRTVDPMVRILAYAPRDFNEDGFLAPMQGEQRTLSRISAHYTVTSIESFFQEGVFKQKLGGFRATQQDFKELGNLASTGKVFNASTNTIDLTFRKK